MKFYLDEDISPKVTQILRKEDIDAVSAHEAGMIGAPDEDQLTIAAAEGRVLVTRNRDDFIILTVRFFEDFKPHCGLLIVPHTLSGADFHLLSSLISTFAKEHPKGLTSYTIEFLSR